MSGSERKALASFDSSSAPLMISTTFFFAQPKMTAYRALLSVGL